MVTTGPSLRPLAPTTATDDPEPVSVWPEPPPKVPEAESGQVSFAQRSLPIDPGDWGRPPMACAEGATLTAAPAPAGSPAPVNPPTTSPPATSPAVAPIGPTSPSPSLSSRHRKGALIEAAVAVILLAGLASVAPASHAASVAGGSTATARWTRAALPALSNLIHDSTTIEKDSGPASAVTPDLWRADAARYGLDLATAQRLPPPPDAGLAQLWRSTLSQLTTAKRDLYSSPAADPETLARDHVHFEAVETVLLEFEQGIRPAQ